MVSPIEFKLFAPRNEEVSLIGTFSDWKDIPMKKGEDGYFRASVDLEDGNYQYKFRVRSNSPNLLGQVVDVNDPYMAEMDRKSETGIAHVKEGHPLYPFHPLSKSAANATFRLTIAELSISPTQKLP
jgi:1,4-alpha-glucan branching enzyme